MPFQRSLVFTETRTTNPVHYILPLQNEGVFQIVFTHSIHLTDVTETYKALPQGEVQLLSMEYSDVAIGMPSYAEEGQALLYENGIYYLTYDEAILPDFVLYIGDVDYKLELLHNNSVYDLKSNLERGNSYLLKVKKLSMYDKLKGVELK
ncbi:DUF1850 domain-containing protein [Lysinibacillus louembei]|uniref:DUF1850 domain-containing protein n=1 Tax=Lysinibacillus louembei TaxID=1470088 RepID=A0ABZ0RWX0_9BACI|nr:DUF1850 domain-containing protein [Lysinibacillus louembei]WPK12729.1 DUF1850 domain-containing protein [Lysinibacillus louembei]